MPAISRESASRNAHAEVYALLGERLAAGSILDIPCGSGAFLRRLLDGGYTTCGADIIPHEAVPPDAKFIAADMNDPLPYKGASFDAVVSIEGIEHIRRPFDFIGECARILKPGGLLILTTPNISSLRSRWRWFLTGFHNKGKYPLDETNPRPRHHINLLSYPQLRYILHTAGLRITRIETNQIKMASWLYAPIAPIARLVTAWVFKRGAKNSALEALYRDVARDLYSRPVCFGETAVLVARKS